MLQKFLKEVIVIVAGKQSEDIAILLDNKKHVNEFIIAKKLDITINQTRNILYKISDYGLVSSIRKKDKKKGWYTYFWKIEVLKVLEFLNGILTKKRDQIINQINSRETREFYFCERCNIEFNQENALLNNFTCNECGDIFSLKDNTKVLKELKRNLTRVENEIKLVEELVEKEREKIEKEKQKEIVSVKKKVADARKVRLAASKKLRDANKVVEKIPKKKIVKKVVKKKIKKIKVVVSKKKTIAKKRTKKVVHLSVYAKEARVPLRQVGLKEGPKARNIGAMKKIKGKK